jgi:hypothetical protein
MSEGSSSIIGWAMGTLALVVILWQSCEISDLREEVASLSDRVSEAQSAAKRDKGKARPRPIEHRSLAPAEEPVPPSVAAEGLEEEEPEDEAALEEQAKRRQEEKKVHWLEAQLERNEAKVRKAVEEGLVPARAQGEVVDLLQAYSQSMWNRKTGMTNGEQSWQEAQAQYVRQQAETHARLVDLIGEDAAKKLGPGPPRTTPGE